MKSALKAVSCFLAVAMIVVATSFSSGALAGTLSNDATAASQQKTHKRKCTNHKCKQVSESTQPIFKCPHCGSSTVAI